jgi:photosystem II stability/assembly factor-like uncharacterized protein
MRKFARILLISAAFAAFAADRVSAQEGAWTKVYDAPAADVVTIEMFDDTLGLASTSTVILRTVDGGATWDRIAPERVASAAAFGFADAQRVWAVGGADGLARSDDGGITWAPQQSGTKAFLQSIAVMSRDKVWVAGYGGVVPEETRGGVLSPDVQASDVAPTAYYDSALLSTADGGATWTPVQPHPGYHIFYSVTFVGDDGWIVASPCRPGQAFTECPLSRRALLRTTDGGANWQAFKTADVTIGSVVFADEQLGFATSHLCISPCVRHIWRTLDGGETWDELPHSPAEPQRLRIDPDGDLRTDTYACVEAVCTGALWRSSDGGDTWSQFPLEPPVFGVFDVTTTHALVTSRADGVVRYDLLTNERSVSKTPLRPAFWYVAFDPDSDVNGFATAFRAYQVTADGGRAWTRIGQPAQLGQLYPVGERVVWATADGACETCPTLYRSTDDGRTWTGLDGPWWYISTLQPADATRAWVVADNGLWRSDDAGATWRLLQDGNSAGNYAFVGRDFGYSRTCGIYQCTETFRVSYDGGVTWETRPLPTSDGLTFVTPDVGFAMRFEGIQDCPCTFPLTTTTDGGRTWNDVARLPFHLGNFTFTDARNGWALGGYEGTDRSAVHRTTDGGRTWTVDLLLPEYTYAQELMLHGDRLSVHAGAGGFGCNHHVFIYERVIASPTTPPVVPPNTGAGPVSTAPSRAWWVFGGLAAGAVIAAVGLGPARRSPANFRAG